MFVFVWHIFYIILLNLYRPVRPNHTNTRRTNCRMWIAKRNRRRMGFNLIPYIFIMHNIFICMWVRKALCRYNTSIYVQCVHIVEKPGHKPAGISYKTIKHISVRRYEHINVVLHYPFFPPDLNWTVELTQGCWMNEFPLYGPWLIYLN